MDRTNDIVIPESTDWLRDAAVQSVCTAITAGGYEVFFVGGCVRNALLGEPVSDVDLSTNARPETVIKLAEAAGHKAVPTGIGHGTITVVAAGTGFEVTTFRRDVETDGRRAVVAFSEDITDDALRRDFTMNAVYATSSGQVIDPLDGLPDLLARRVRFIEDPVARIREDYLRILRFFRFMAWYGDPTQGQDPDTLAAISANIAGLEHLSAERTGQEFAKLLAAPDPSPVVATMQQLHVLGAILPGAECRFLAPLIHLEGLTSVAGDWRCRLAIIGGDDVSDRLRLSKADARAYHAFRHLGFSGPSLAEVAYRHGEKVAQQVLLIRSSLAELPPESDNLELIHRAAQAKFPLRAQDLLPDHQGPALGAKLAELEQFWINGDFAPTRADLLGRV